MTHNGNDVIAQTAMPYGLLWKFLKFDIEFHWTWWREFCCDLKFEGRIIVIEWWNPVRICYGGSSSQCKGGFEAKSSSGCWRWGKGT